jgi:hypothetical protein
VTAAAKLPELHPLDVVICDTIATAFAHPFGLEHGLDAADRQAVALSERHRRRSGAQDWDRRYVTLAAYFKLLKNAIRFRDPDLDFYMRSVIDLISELQATCAYGATVVRMKELAQKTRLYAQALGSPYS